MEPDHPEKEKGSFSSAEELRLGMRTTKFPPYIPESVETYIEKEDMKNVFNFTTMYQPRNHAVIGTRATKTAGKPGDEETVPCVRIHVTVLFVGVLYFYV